jgi:hypothetical protein
MTRHRAVFQLSKDRKEQTLALKQHCCFQNLLWNQATAWCVLEASLMRLRTMDRHDHPW